MSTAAETRGDLCCDARTMQWLLDDILVAGAHGGTIPTGLVDQLPPWRALLYVTVAVQAAARLEHGTIGELHDAANKNSGTARAGWWSAHLGLTSPAPMLVRPRNDSPVGRLTH